VQQSRRQSSSESVIFAFGSRKCIWEDNIKIDREDVLFENVVDSFSFVQCLVAICYERDNEPYDVFLDSQPPV
jgi:hypothetical protein